MKRLTLVMLPALLAMLVATAHAAGSQSVAAGMKVAQEGVSALISQTPFTGDILFVTDRGWEPVTVEDLPQSITGHVTLTTDNAIVTVSENGSTLSYWTRNNESVVRRGEVKLDSTNAPAQFKLHANAVRPGLAVDVLSPDQSRRHTIALSADGVLQIDQRPGQRVSVASRMPYLLAPSLVGTDLLYSGADLKGSSPSFVVSTNVVVGLLDDHDGMMVAVWPPGNQVARIANSTTGSMGTIDRFILDTAGQSFYLAYLELPNIWHEEVLKADYLEKDTKLAWERPLEARWIGRFHIESDDYSFPFYFLYEKHRLWGRYIRGWFYYPVWFDFADTMVHFEKKFPPKGRLLIYYLDTFREKTGDMSPLGVMRSALGAGQVAKLLDFAGTRERPLLPHGNAVCAMTREIERHFAAGLDAPPRSLANSYADDVATFIRLIRERIIEYDQFAGETLSFLERQKQSDPRLADSMEAVEDILTEMQNIAREDLPKASLDEVRGWTQDIRASSDKIEIGDLARVKKLAQRCRAVAGTQDDMARDLSVLAIRLMEEAARMGTASAQHAQLAGQLIAKTRLVLRQPTWWEVCRRFEPKSNPGAE